MTLFWGFGSGFQRRANQANRAQFGTEFERLAAFSLLRLRFSHCQTRLRSLASQLTTTPAGFE